MPQAPRCHQDLFPAMKVTSALPVLRSTILAQQEHIMSWAPLNALAICPTAFPAPQANTATNQAWSQMIASRAQLDSSAQKMGTVP